MCDCAVTACPTLRHYCIRPSTQHYFPLLCLAFYCCRGMASLQDFEQYSALHDAVEDANTVLESIQCGTVEQRAVWEARRACWRYGRYPRPGTAETTKAALKAAHAQTLLCMESECRSLVDLQSARAVARAAGRRAFRAGDGCASRRCSAKFWKSRYHSQQQKMAAALRDSSRTLVLWPATTKGRVKLHVAPATLAASIAESVDASVS